MNNSQDSSWVGCTNSLLPGGSQLEVLKTSERSLAVHLLTCGQRHTHIHIHMSDLWGYHHRLARSQPPYRIQEKESALFFRLVCLIKFFSPGFPEMTSIFTYALISSPQQAYIESDNLSTCRDKLLSVPVVWVVKIRWYPSHGSADAKSFSNLNMQSRGAVVLRAKHSPKKTVFNRLK